MELSILATWRYNVLCYQGITGFRGVGCAARETSYRITNWLSEILALRVFMVGARCAQLKSLARVQI